MVCSTGPLCHLAEVEERLENVLLFQQGIRVVCGPLPLQFLRSSLPTLTLEISLLLSEATGGQSPGWGDTGRPPPQRPRVQGFTGTAAGGGTGPVSGAAVGWGAGDWGAGDAAQSPAAWAGLGAGPERSLVFPVGRAFLAVLCSQEDRRRFYSAFWWLPAP